MIGDSNITVTMIEDLKSVNAYNYTYKHFPSPFINQMDQTYQGSSGVVQEEEGQGPGASPDRCAGSGAPSDHPKVMPYTLTRPNIFFVENFVLFCEVSIMK